ncbi:MAG: tRNA lysidine(34) synthetase TilS, partial [Gemmatimonadales bacterium]|nr:tRNA lysidine(34) synthetase TilS [Gemmatimonadales bacterium]
MTLQRRFDRHLRGFHLPSGPALVAVSGGPDSLALLFLLHHSRVARRLRLSVAHVDHGIHPESARVARSVEQAAHRLGLSFAGKRLELGRAATETKAREARYRWLVEEAERAGARLIFTAHHRDDQIETIVMRLLKGSGPAGLAGIPSRRGRLVRPLLPFRREELAAFLHEQGVNAWQDPANSDPRHERSQVRTELLPRLRERFPGIEESLLEMGRLAAAERTAWDALLESLPELDLTRDGDGVSVAATPLRGYDSGVLRGLLAALGRRVGYQVGPARAGRIERLLAGGQSGAVAELGSGGAAELSFGRLRLFRGGRHLTCEPRVVSGG